MESLNEWRTLRGHTHPVNFVAFSMGGKLLATGDDGGNVLIWCPAIGVLLEAFSSQPKALSCCWRGDRGLFVGYDDGTIQFLARNSSTCRFVRNTVVHLGGHPVTSLAVNNHYLACAAGIQAYCWRIEKKSLRQIARWTAHVDSIEELSTVHFVDSHKLLVTAGIHEGNCILFDLLEEPSKPKWICATLVPILDAALSLDGRYLATTDLDTLVHIYEVVPQSGIILRTGLAPPPGSRTCIPMRICFANQRLVAAGSGDGKIWLWDIERGMRFVVSHTATEGSGLQHNMWPSAVDAMASFSSGKHHYMASACQEAAGINVIRVWRSKPPATNDPSTKGTASRMPICMLLICLMMLVIMFSQPSFQVKQGTTVQ